MSDSEDMFDIKEVCGCEEKENYLRCMINELIIPIGSEYPKNEQVAAYEAAIEIAADNGKVDIVDAIFDKMESDYFDNDGITFKRQSLLTALFAMKESDLKNTDVGDIIESLLTYECDYTDTDFKFTIAYHNGYVNTCNRLSNGLSHKMKYLLNKGLSNSLFDQMFGEYTDIVFNTHSDDEELRESLPTTNESYPFNDDCYNF